jgi:hypothetical protein
MEEIWLSLCCEEDAADDGMEDKDGELHADEEVDTGKFVERTWNFSIISEELLLHL